MATQVIMPQLGESVVEGTVMKWLKQEGERVEENEALLEVNTDKVDTEIPSPASGTLLRILVPEGETVAARTVIALIGEPGEAAPENGGDPTRPVKAQALAEPEARPPVETPAAPAPAAGRDRDLGFISPVVARMASEHKIDLNRVRGTGQGGRITKKDLQAFLDQQARPEVEAPAWETPGEGDLFRPTELQFGTQAREQQPAPPAEPQKPPAAAARPLNGDQVLPLSTMRRSIAEHMAFSKRTAPHVTTVMEADLSRVAAHRSANAEDFARSGAKLTYTAYFAAAAVAALKAYPLVNSSWSDEGIVLHSGINLGIATSLGEEGLIVPVIKGADGLSLLGLARAINDLAERARSRRLQPDEVKNGTFTITNHGISGSLFASPVINQPQVAILGVGAIQKRPVVVQDDAIAVRSMVYLTLTFDHRVLDGASADGFLARVVAALENWA